MEIGKQKYGLSILLRCGGGAYGEVYLCQDASGKQVALKVIDKAKVGAGWERELKGISHYRHLAEGLPHLLQLYHVGEDAEAFYYTMELADAIPGQPRYQADTLAARLAGGPLPQGQMLPILSAILEAIQTLHAAGFAHRDIKPENILFIQGEPKLADLGLLSPLTGTMTQLVGTLSFLPPEERLGESAGGGRESRQRHDLYAFGKLIYCCVTGKGADEYPSLPSDLAMTLPNKYLWRLSLHLCEREPAHRLQRLADLQKEWQRIHHLCEHGERAVDKLQFAVGAAVRRLRSLVTSTRRFWRRHWLSATMLFSLLLGGCILGEVLKHPFRLSLLFSLLLGGCLRLVHHLSGSPDQASVEVAKALQAQKELAVERAFTDYTFYHGRYSIAVPTDWQIFTHEDILRARLPGDVLAQRLHGLLLPPGGEGNACTTISLMILPVTDEQLGSLDEQEKIQALQPLLGEDIEAITLRQYRNSRLQLEPLLLVGEAHPAKSIVSCLYPQSSHTLCLLAVIPREKIGTDLGKFMAITDSLVWR